MSFKPRIKDFHSHRNQYNDEIQGGSEDKRKKIIGEINKQNNGTNHTEIDKDSCMIFCTVVLIFKMNFQIKVDEGEKIGKEEDNNKYS